MGTSGNANGAAAGLATAAGLQQEITRAEAAEALLVPTAQLESMVAGKVGTGGPIDAAFGAAYVPPYAKTVAGPVAPPPWINVRDYGARGDDVTDDTAAIQAAINACPGGSVVLLGMGGKYRTSSPLYLPRGVTLLGPGAPRWSYTFAPQSYIKPLATFAGAACVHLRDMQLAGYASEQGNIRINNVCLDGSAIPTATSVDGILGTGLVRDVRIQNVSVRNFTNAGIHTVSYVRADNSTNYPRGWEMTHVVADTNKNQGFAHNSLDDSIHLDCLAVSNGTDGFYLAGVGEDHMIGCRSVFNGNNGFHVTGTSFGSLVMSGCTTDRNQFNGMLIDATGKLPIVLSGLGLRRDGRNGDAGGGGYAALRTSGATVPIVATGIVTGTGQNDDATGAMSPEYALRVGNTYALQVSSSWLHGYTAAVQNDGGNTNYFLAHDCTQVTGSANAPVIGTFAAP